MQPGFFFGVAHYRYRCCLCMEAGPKTIAVLQIIGSFCICAQTTQLFYHKFDRPHPEEGYSHDAVYLTMCASVSLILFINGFLSCLLLSAAQAMNWRKCLPWLYWNYFMLGLTILVALGFLTFLGWKEQWGFGILIFGVCTFVFGLILYFVMMIRKFIKQIKEPLNH